MTRTKTILRITITLILLTGIFIIFQKNFISKPNLSVNGLNLKQSSENLSVSNMSSIIQKTSPMDFFIQDVCLDDSNQVIVGASPFDTRCISTRDLSVGESISYHKSDNPNDTNEIPGKGDTRFDAIPVQTVLGIAAADIADNPNAEGQYLTYDNGPDAIHMYGSSDNSIYHNFSLDHSGPYRQVTEYCTENTTEPDAAIDGNAVIGLIGGKLTGEILGSFKKLNTRYVNTSGPCPKQKDRDSVAFWKFDILQWSITGSPDTLTPPLLTLYNAAVKEEDDSHIEITFYTRELGQIRHESWNNAKNSKWTSNDVVNFKETEKKILANNFCNTPTPTPPFPDSPESEWILVSCRQETKIIPPDNPKGDSSDVWINALKNIELSAPLLGASLPLKPVIDRVSSSTGVIGSTFKIYGKNFSKTNNTVIFGKSCIIGKILPSIESNGEMSISVQIPDRCNSSNMKYCKYSLSILNDSAFSDSEDFFYTILNSNGPQDNNDVCAGSLR